MTMNDMGPSRGPFQRSNNNMGWILAGVVAILVAGGAWVVSTYGYRQQINPPTQTTGQQTTTPETPTPIERPTTPPQ